jgi:hypothetical protein
MDEDRLFKFKNRYIIHSIKYETGNKRLVFMFSVVDATPGFCRMSHYAKRELTGASTVHIMDNLGAHGCYLLSIAGDRQVRNAVLSLIKSVIAELDIDPSEVYFAGTSKGGTTAIAYSMMLGCGNVIAGEPQTLLGDFIYNSNWEQLEQWRSLSYAITGRVDPDDRPGLNALIPEVINQYAYKYRGRVSVILGETGYWKTHIEPLQNLFEVNGIGEKLQIDRRDFTQHNDVIPAFDEAMAKIYAN